MKGLPYHHPNPEEKFAATAHLSKKERKSCAKKKENTLKTHSENIPRPI